jgi:hypothetical protein
VGDTDSAFDPSDDPLYPRTAVRRKSGFVAGFNVTWSYYGFRADLRGATSTSAGDHARAFRVTYTSRF